MGQEGGWRGRNVDMQTKNTDTNVSTLYTNDLHTDLSGVEEIENRLSVLDRRLKAISTENLSLKHHLSATRENHSLRAAAVLNTILTWIDSDHKGKPPALLVFLIYNHILHLLLC